MPIKPPDMGSKIIYEGSPTIKGFSEELLKGFSRKKIVNGSVNSFIYVHIYAPEYIYIYIFFFFFGATFQKL